MEQLLEIEAVRYLLVLTRVSGIFLFAPIISSNSVPRLVKAWTAVAMAALVYPLSQTSIAAPGTILDVVIITLGELLVGMVMGAMLQFSFSALQLAGQVSGTQLGLTLANVVNPQFDEQISTTSVIYVTVASLIFLSTGIHREVFVALFESFEALPLGTVLVDQGTLFDILGVFEQSMKFAVRVSAPVVVSLFFTELAMGFVGRTVPQLNVQSVGFSLRILLGLFITVVSLAAAAIVFHDQLTADLTAVYRALASLAP